MKLLQATFVDHLSPSWPREHIIGCSVSLRLLCFSHCSCSQVLLTSKTFSVKAVTSDESFSLNSLHVQCLTKTFCITVTGPHFPAEDLFLRIFCHNNDHNTRNTSTTTARSSLAPSLLTRKRQTPPLVNSNIQIHDCLNLLSLPPKNEEQEQRTSLPAQVASHSPVAQTANTYLPHATIHSFLSRRPLPTAS